MAEVLRLHSRRSCFLQGMAVSNGLEEKVELEEVLEEQVSQTFDKIQLLTLQLIFLDGCDPSLSSLSSILKNVFFKLSSLTLVRFKDTSSSSTSSTEGITCDFVLDRSPRAVKLILDLLSSCTMVHQNGVRDDLLNGEDELLSLKWGPVMSENDIDNSFIQLVIIETGKCELPKEFIESTKRTGLIVSWCNQFETLANHVIGCFMTHCE
ncbi:hypothetical protein RND71_003096 [Anisodus tanguticus]|uniref:Uncharacterized protein n=1 Tax=Anisodus tanguticus TaxID=243964 RepID=A0AAE1SVB2_9SOLA|nr:hypothetical protein RND71_003096 [Anisodus tanguticus]